MAGARVAGAVAAAGAALLAAEWWLERSGDEPALARFRTVALVSAAPAVAWEFLGDLEAQVRWMHDAKAIRVLTPGPVRVGTRAEADVRIFGLGSTDPIEITAWEPPRRFAIRHLGVFAGEGEFVLKAEGGATRVTATRVTWTERLVAPVFPHLAAIALHPVLAHVFRADLDRFARLVEEAAAPSPPGS